MSRLILNLPKKNSFAMIFKVETHKLMFQCVKEALDCGKGVCVEDAVHLDVPFDSLTSLYGQEYVKRNQSAYKIGNISSILDRVMKGKEAMSSAICKIPMGKYIIAKQLLEKYMFLQFPQSQQSEAKVADFLINPFIVENQYLRSGLLELFAQDAGCSPQIDLLKETCGREYEALLVTILNTYHMSYETEVEMRKKGKPKTPDIWFTIPMAVACNDYEHQLITSRSLTSQQYDGEDNMDDDQDFMMTSMEFDADGRLSPNRSLLSSQDSETINNNTTTPATATTTTAVVEEDQYIVVNWIDSKAMFADAKTFKDHLSQFKAYYNRYGRGMVIYWHGYVEDVYQHIQEFGDNIIIRDTFPEKWMFPTGEPADGRVPTFLQSQTL